DAVAAFLPDRRVPIGDLATQLGLTPGQVRVLHRFHGLSEVCRARPEETPLDLLTAATGALDELRGQEHRVRYVLYARGVPVTTPFPVNPLHELCDRFGLGHALAFTVTHQACASNLLAIDLAGRLLRTDGVPDALALIVAGETVFTQDVRLPPEARVFGEGSGACLVSADGRRDRVLSYVSRQRGDLDQWLPGNAGFAERFAAEYRGLLAGVILAAVERAGLRVDDLALILPHNVNMGSWQRVSRLLRFPSDRVMLHNVPRVGHTFAADAFINYRTALDKGLLEPGDFYLVAAAGYGATFSAMVFEH
ncbi:MAG TPA: 3-oxoacyl-[acyl-carrier-protein] synthase III C-terminal domain-containing protein, partial [Micromonosporaceae bacterium]|nr:3-oxoacyl-[acyl-carrier-protein] synthase III C-terminal domain-containing protein [Micromonosporaceae bacterium]